MGERHAEQRLVEVRGQIEQWRCTREKRCAMPEHLWNKAIALAGEIEPYRVSRTLRLNYDSLKRRVIEKAAQPPAGSKFVELRGIQAFAQAPEELSAGGAVVQVVNRDGAQLTIRLDPSQMDVAGLVHAFLRRGT